MSEKSNTECAALALPSILRAAFLLEEASPAETAQLQIKPYGVIVTIVRDTPKGPAHAAQELGFQEISQAKFDVLDNLISSMRKRLDEFSKDSETLGGEQMNAR